MANIKSQIKRNRQNERRREGNVAVRSALKTARRRFRETLEAGDHEAARRALLAACRQHDKAAEKGVIHRRNAANHKSRLWKAFNGAAGPAA